MLTLAIAQRTHLVQQPPHGLVALLLQVFGGAWAVVVDVINVVRSNLMRRLVQQLRTLGGIPAASVAISVAPPRACGSDRVVQL